MSRETIGIGYFSSYIILNLRVFLAPEADIYSFHNDVGLVCWVEMAPTGISSHVHSLRLSSSVDWVKLASL